jgi:RNA polymerase sigma factor (sigma-70 family)
MIDPNATNEVWVARLLEEHLPALRAFVRLRMGPAVAARESSADVVQSVCRELLASRDRFEFRGDAALHAWLYTAALRKIMQKSRRHRSPVRDVVREAPIDPDTGLLSCYASCITPSRDASAKEQLERFERAFARLSDADREVITLSKIVRLPHAEVARQMGRSVESSRTALRRALVRLAAHLEPDSVS